MFLFDLYTSFRVNLVRLFISILFRKKSKPFLLKFLELKSGMISDEEFQNWVVTDGMGYNDI